MHQLARKMQTKDLYIKLPHPTESAVSVDPKTRLLKPSCLQFPSMSPARAQRSPDDIYSMASSARSKLQAAADRPDHCLRRLCGHANMLDGNLTPPQLDDCGLTKTTALMEDLTELLEEQVTSLDDALLGLEDDSESEELEETEERIDNFVNGQAQRTSPASTIADPLKASRAGEEMILRRSPCQSAVVGHAYDMVPSRSAHRFEPALCVIQENDFDKADESTHDESSPTTPNGDCAAAPFEALPALPPVLANDGLITAACDPQCIDEALGLMEPGFGSELERVSSRREMVAAIAR